MKEDLKLEARSLKADRRLIPKKEIPAVPIWKDSEPENVPLSRPNRAESKFTTIHTTVPVLIETLTDSQAIKEAIAARSLFL